MSHQSEFTEKRTRSRRNSVCVVEVLYGCCTVSTPLAGTHVRTVLIELLYSNPPARFTEKITLRIRTSSKCRESERLLAAL
jgi:hypothetical protein